MSFRVRLSQQQRKIKSSLDSADFECLFLRHGIEKEGMAFPADSLKYYNGVLPDGQPDNIVFVNDDAADSLAMLADYLSTGIKTVSVGKRPF